MNETQSNQGENKYNHAKSVECSVIFVFNESRIMNDCIKKKKKLTKCSTLGNKNMKNEIQNKNFSHLQSYLKCAQSSYYLSPFHMKTDDLRKHTMIDYYTGLDLHKYHIFFAADNNLIKTKRRHKTDENYLHII